MYVDGAKHCHSIQRAKAKVRFQVETSSFVIDTVTIKQLFAVDSQAPSNNTLWTKEKNRDILYDM